MITKDKIKNYKKYMGDGDMFCRCARKRKKHTTESNDFLTIDYLIQNIQIIQNGLASSTFKDKFINELKDKVDTDCPAFVL
jgi:hypothetical protein